MQEANKEQSVTKGKKAIMGLAALAVAGGIGAMSKNTAENHAFDEAFKTDNLAERVENGTAPKEVEATDVVKITRGQGESAWSVVDDMAKPGRTQELAGYIEDQTEGQPGVAVIPKDYINMEQAVTTPPAEEGGLTEVAEPH